MNAKYTLVFQVIYYFVTALWPLIHMRSFEAVAGPKKEHWLVYTVSTLLLAILMPFLYVLYLWPMELSEEILILAMSAAFGLAMIDFIFVFRGVIWKTYLFDGFLQLFILGSFILNIL